MGSHSVTFLTIVSIEIGESSEFQSISHMCLMSISGGLFDGFFKENV